MAEPTVTATPPRRGRSAVYIAAGVGLLVALLVGVLATRDLATSKVAESPLVGQPAPPIEGQPILNGDFELADARGRWVVLNFFATWCVPCREEHPELVAFSERHLRTGDAQVVSVVFSDRASDVERFFRERGGEWPVLDDPVGRVALEYGVSGVPESYLIDPAGFVAAKIIGGVRAEHLDQLLAEAAARRGGG